MVHIGLIIWHQFLFCKINVLLSVFIVSKIENIPPIRKFSKIKNKKTAITFDEECTIGIFVAGHFWIIVGFSNILCSWVLMPIISTGAKIIFFNRMPSCMLTGIIFIFTETMHSVEQFSKMPVFQQM